LKDNVVGPILEDGGLPRLRQGVGDFALSPSPRRPAHDRRWSSPPPSVPPRRPPNLDLDDLEEIVLQEGWAEASPGCDPGLHC
jgi:hypothetical protein